MPNYKLGKLAPKRSMKTPALGNFMQPKLVPAPPAKAYWEYRVKDWPMYSNDTVGDCTCAAAGHMIQSWTAHGVGQANPSDADVLGAYSAITGYDASSGANDNGAAELDVLNYWTQNGIAGHKIQGYASLDVQNIAQIKAAIYLFGGVYLGFQVSQSAMDQTQARQAWDVDPNDGGILGGHAVPAMGYGAQGGAVITWGQIQHFTWEFWQKYVDEAYCLISPDWLNQFGKSPTGLDLPGLQAALKSL